MQIIDSNAHAIPPNQTALHQSVRIVCRLETGSSTVRQKSPLCLFKGRDERETFCSCPPATSYVVNVSRLLKNAKAPDHAYIRRVYVLDWLLGKD